jgi:hypothetical protein
MKIKFQMDKQGKTKILTRKTPKFQKHESKYTKTNPIKPASEQI